MSEEVKKKNVFRTIGKFFKDVKSELKKVVWPTPKQTLKNTGIVLIFVLLIGICIWVLDAVFNFGMFELLKLRQG